MDPNELYQKLKPLLITCKQENGSVTIDTIVDEFMPILTEFLLFTKPFLVNETEYTKILIGFVDKLTETFPKLQEIDLNSMHVRSNMYDTTSWGPLYWDFIHYSSILLNYAMRRGLLRDVSQFPSIIMNIDYALPCSICKGHYQQIKRSNEVLMIIKEIAYGQVIEGACKFHNLITMNINSAMGTNKQLFSIYDLTMKYRVLEYTPMNLKKIVSYIPCELFFVPRLHAILAKYMYAKLQENMSYTQVVKGLQESCIDLLANKDFNNPTLLQSLESMFKCLQHGPKDLDKTLIEYYPNEYSKISSWLIR